MNILITGINGFIGSSLKNFIKIKYFSWNIYGIDWKVKKTKENFNIDIKNKKSVKTILKEIKPVYIFHLVGNTLSKDFKELLLSHVVSTFVIFDAIKEIENYKPRIIIPSSAAEYGRVSIQNMPLRENCMLNPISLYGLSKAIQTELSLMFCKRGLDIVIARMFNISGNGAPVNLSIGKFAYELALIKKKKRKPIIHTKNLDTKRDFLDISDICRYLVAVAINGKRGGIYNICSGKFYCIRDLLYKLIKISGINNVEIIENKDRNRESDLEISFGSTKKLKKIVRLSSLIPIDKSLREAYFYYLSRV